MIPSKETSKGRLQRRIYITNLKPEVVATDLRRIFETVGVVLDADIMMTAFSNKPTGLGYVEVGNQFDLGRAFKKLNGKKIKGCRIRLYNKRCGSERRKIPNRRQNSDRRKKETRNLLQLNEITFSFIALENQGQVERRISEQRILDERRMRERRSSLE